MTPESEGLYHITREPGEPCAGGTPPPLLVLIHGYGSDERDLMGLAPNLDGRLRSVSVRAPRALEQGGYCWFPVEFTPVGLVVDYDEAESARRRLAELITAHQERHGVSPDDTYLLGFSQGATMALAVGLADPRGSAGVASLSGLCTDKMIPTEAEAVAALRDKPFFVAHGLGDPLIPIAQGRSVDKLLQSLPVDLTYREYAMGHEINADCLSDLSRWLSQRLTPTRPSPV